MGMRDLDVVTLGTMMAEISPPRAGVRIAEAEHLTLFPAGSATIFALALARLGGRIGLISRVGDDELGRWMRSTLAAAGVDATEISAVPGQLTPLSLASVDDAGHKTFAYYRFAGVCDPLAILRAEDVSDEYLGRARIFDLTESSLRSPALRAVALRLAERGRANGCAVCFNPNYRPTAWAGGATEAASVLRSALGLADLAIMNGDEARLISSQVTVEAAARWLVAAGPRLIVVTRGAEQTLVATPSGIAGVPVVPTEVVFDIGAGDTFHAGFLAVWTPGADPIACARFAATAAALKIARPPRLDQLPTRDEVESRLGESLSDRSA
jgi:sugar/nucleoside kinase (ribokinase family)